MTGREASGLLGQGVLVLALSLSGCGEPPVLEVGPVGFRAEEVADLTADQQATLAQITGLGLAVAEGRVAELVEPRIQGDLRSIVLQRVAMEIAAEDQGVDEAALREAYDRNPRYELVVRHLVVLSERWRPPEHRDSARARAAEALERARAGEDFETLVAEYSDEPGAAERGGLLQPGREGSWVPEFWEAASSLDVGEISDVVETEFGFHVLRLEDRRRIPFDEVRDDVLEHMVDLPRALGRASEWVASIQSRMRLDSAALHQWQDAGSQETSEATGAGMPLVSWPDSAAVPDFGTADLEDYLRTFRGESLSAARALPWDRLVDLVRSASRTHILLTEAEQMGVEPSESQRAAIEDRWNERVNGWAAAFGFQPGMSRRAVKAQALEALTTLAQSAAQARAELPRLGSRIAELYPVSSSSDAVNSATSG